MGMYIIAEPCIGTKDTACVDVCPVDCIHPRKDEGGFATAEMLYIDPDVCIQCGNCEPACPVTAIFTEETIPEKWKHFLQVNADWYKNNRSRGGALRPPVPAGGPGRTYVTFFSTFAKNASVLASASFVSAALNVFGSFDDANPCPASG